MEEKFLTLRDALTGGPGLDGYAFNADVYCIPCGQAITRDVFQIWARRDFLAGEAPQGVPYPYATDSDELPQPIFFGEHELPQHCANCAVYMYGGIDAALDSGE